MLNKISIALVLAVMAFCIPVQADEAFASKKAESPSQQIHKIAVNIPQSIDEGTLAKIIEKLSGMEKQRFVYLDLSINFSSEKVSSKPYSVMTNGKPHEKAAKGCSIGVLPMRAGVSYELGPVADYNHLLISLFTGDRSAFPYNDVSCEYVNSGSESQFRVRGFFHVLGNSIPTATALQLRPFNPPFEVAQSIFARSQ